MFPRQSQDCSKEARGAIDSLGSVNRDYGRVLTLLLGLIMSAAVPSAAYAQDDSKSIPLRVMTYNIHHGEGTDGKVDLERLAKVIRDAKPDLVALQEVDDKTERTSKVDQLRELSRLTEMHGLFAKQIPYEGGEYGQAVLSRYPLKSITVNWLPGEPERQRRIAAAAEVEIGSRKLLFVTTHLHHQNAEFREQQSLKLAELFDNSEDPVIIAGDFNAGPESRVIKGLHPDWTNATAGSIEHKTYPSESPSRQLDYILLRSRDTMTIENTLTIPESIASDHLPLLVQLTLPALSK